MNSFKTEFIALFKRKSARIIKAQLAMMESGDEHAGKPGGVFLQLVGNKFNRRKNRRKIRNKQNDADDTSRGNICRLRLGQEKELREKKKVFCSMYQPFDTTDERSMNIAMFHISKDVGNDVRLIEAVSKTARFAVRDECYSRAPMMSGDDFSLQKINTMGEKTETNRWVLVAKLDTSKKG